MLQKPLHITVPISLGECIDKLSILAIKRNKMQDARKQEAVTKELSALTAVLGVSLKKEEQKQCESYLARLVAINTALWEIEDLIRSRERQKLFDEGFMLIARSIYRINDERFAVKREINEYFNADIQEQKEYAYY